MAGRGGVRMAHRIPAARTDADGAPVFVHRGFVVAHGDMRDAARYGQRPGCGAATDVDQRPVEDIPIDDILWVTGPVLQGRMMSCCVHNPGAGSLIASRLKFASYTRRRATIGPS
jgi:hypothetical protein